MVTIDTTLEENNSSPTKTSVLIKFLIKVCFLPISFNKNEERIAFRVISLRCLAYTAIYVGLGILSPLSMRFILNEDTLTKMKDGKNVVQKYTMLSNNIFCVSFIFPLLIAKGLDNINIKIVWNERLPFPKHGIKSIITYFVSVTGSQVALVAIFLQNDVPLQDLARCISVTLSGKFSYDYYDK